MRSVASKPKGLVNKKNGSLYVTLGHLIDMFYVSRFNRDNKHDPAKDEDIDNSYKYRIYNKSDVKELMKLFMDFFEWVINEKNIGKIYLSKNLTLLRDVTLPRIKYANAMDAKYNPECTEGEYYITHGRYEWRLWLDNEAYDKMREIVVKDPELIKRTEELIPLLEEKNKNAKSKSKDKPT